METKETLTKTKWTIDPAHSEIAFKVKHLMITSVSGVFRKYDASIYTTGDDFMTAEVDVFIDASSVDTGDEKRDAHLRSADFFDAENHRQLSFTGNTYEKTGEETYLLHGDLTIKGVSKRIKLNVEFGGIIKDPWDNRKAGMTVTGKINRKEWGLEWNAALESGGVLVSDEIRINCEVQLVKASA